MSKISLTNLVNLNNQTTAVNAINANNAVLTTALDNTVSRDGTTPNQMSAPLDMNSNRILNLPTALSVTEPVSLAQMNAALVANGNTNTGLTGVPVSAAMQPVVNSTTIGAAQSQLGIFPISTAMQPVVNASTIAAANALLGTPSQTIQVTPQQYDILAGTAGHDSTQAIISAIANCPVGGTVRLPATTGGYLVSNGFKITSSISIVGDGHGTFFTGTLPANVDLFNVTVPVSVLVRGMAFMNFNIKVSGGRNWFMFDTTGGGILAELEVSNIYTLESPTGPGRSCIYCTSTASGAGAQFDYTFRQNQLYVTSSNACIEFNNIGDSIRIRDSLHTGTGYAVFGNQVAGATNLIIDGLNGTCSHGISLNNCFLPILRNIELEWTGPVSTASCIILNGCSGGLIGPGNISVLSGATGLSQEVTLLTCSNVIIEGMVFSTAIGGTGILIGAGCTGTRLTMTNTFNGFGASTVSDSGTGTQHASFT